MISLITSEPNSQRRRKSRGEGEREREGLKKNPQFFITAVFSIFRIKMWGITLQASRLLTNFLMMFLWLTVQNLNSRVSLSNQRNIQKINPEFSHFTSSNFNDKDPSTSLSQFYITH